ncbi:membrane protein insertase YidC [Teredinibacter waterburyi]|jgi:protein translocase subunit yidC|uniref:membrane protein insertase YidC n=1 Tax=Teredinibacter waterburyi TaxID=1500538 RepID=UPI00165FAA21|nr:membrane protein insertase YidC [Teredinibacter waterburyi]
MNWLRNSLIGGIVVILFLLFIRWNDYKERYNAELSPVNEPTISSVVNNAVPSTTNTSIPGSIDTESVSEIPNASVDTSAESAESSLPIATQSKVVHVTTDSFDVLIDTLGGDIIKVALPQYYAKLNQADNPFILLNSTPSHTYVAQSGLIGTNGTDTAAGRPIFSVSKTEYTLDDDANTLTVDLVVQQEGAVITKRFTFTRDSYLIDIQYLIDNRSSQAWRGQLYGQIKRDTYVPPSDTGIGMSPYLGAAITTPETNYKKVSFSDIEDETFKITQPGGWVAMVQHYFMSAWIPNPEVSNDYTLRKPRNSDYYFLGFKSEPTTVAGNSQGVISTGFYAGPKIIKKLETIAPHLDLTIDFGWLWMVAKPLFYALDFIHGWVGNWGIAIILLTFAIKIVFFYPSAMSYRSMAKMRKVQPQMAELKERYGDDRQKMSSELMKLYKKEKVNPMGGCLPILLQMPVFMALYWMLMESVELRHAPFYLWIADMSVKDPFYVLPLLMGATMFIQQKLNPTPPDPMQAKVMQFMPIMFTGLFMFFPAGLVLYWVVNNTLSISQQYVITKQIERS